MNTYYRKTGTVMEFWQIWKSEKGVTTNFGIVGREGSYYEEKLPKGEDAAKYILEICEEIKGKGFSIIEPCDMTQIELSCPTVHFLSVDDLEVRHRIEDAIHNALGWTGNGECDGGQIGSGSMEIFCAVMDLPFAMEAINEILAEEGLLTKFEVKVEE